MKVRSMCPDRSVFRLALCVLGLCLALAPRAQALPLGNPADPALYTNGWVLDCFDSFSFRLGYAHDHVFNRHMESETRSGNPDIDRTTRDTSAALLVFNWCDRADLFVTLGATSIEIETPASAFILNNALNTRFTIASSTHFSWSVGGRVALFNYCNVVVGLEGEYFASCSEVDYAHLDNFNTFYPSNNDKLDYHEWQIGVGLAYPITCCNCALEFVPYIGFKYARAKIGMDQAQFTITGSSSETFSFEDLESKLHWGFPIGVTAVLCGTIGVGVEGRFGDEQALYVNGQVRF